MDGERTISIQDIVAWAEVVGIWDVERLVRLVKAAESAQHEYQSKKLEESQKKGSKVGNVKPTSNAGKRPAFRNIGGRGK